MNLLIELSRGYSGECLSTWSLEMTRHRVLHPAAKTLRSESLSCMGSTPLTFMLSPAKPPLHSFPPVYWALCPYCPSIWNDTSILLLATFLSFFLEEGIVASQHFIAKRISYMHTYIPSLLNFPPSPPYLPRSSQSNELSFPCCVAGSH